MKHGGGAHKKRKAKAGAGKCREMPLAQEGELYARVTRLLGSNRVQARGTDGMERRCTICGRMRKREWVNAGDLVLVASDPGLGDYVVFKYQEAEVQRLGQMGVDVRVPDGGDERDDLAPVDFERDEDAPIDWDVV